MNTTLTWTQQAPASETDVITPLAHDKAGIKAGEPMLYPSGRTVEAYIHAIPEGESRDIATMRRDLAARRGARATCLPTLRDRLLVIAEAVFDQLDDGALLREVAPVWRVHVEHSAVLVSQLSFTPKFFADLRASENRYPALIDRQAA